MKLKPVYDMWFIHTYDEEYEMDNFYKLANESDVMNFISGEIVTTCYGKDVKRGEHETINNIKHSVDYCINEDETNDWKDMLESQTRLGVTKCLLDTINKYRELNPDCVVIVETPGNTVKTKLDICSIYEGREGNLIFDSE